MESSIHDRIRRARVSRGLSLEALASRMGNISKQGLSKFESGTAVPNSTRLLQLAGVLGVKPEYFLRSETIAIATLEFRKHAKMPLYRQEQVKEMMRDHLERYLFLESSFERDAPNQPIPPHSIAVNSPEDAEQAAMKLRERWGVGEDAIADLIDLLESNGFKIVLLHNIDDFDGACAATVDKKHVLFALNGAKPGERMRFTLAHELGHWAMRLPPDMPEQEKERCCNRFAGAFLLPAVQVSAEFGPHQRSRVHPQELFNAKQAYRVSMAMVLMRLQDLDLLSQAGYKALTIQFNRQGWRKAEPGVLPGERPRHFESLVFRGLSERIFTLSRAAELLQLPISKMNDIVHGTLVSE